MSKVPDNHELARQLAVLEERMKTMQAEYKTDIGQLAADIAKRDKANIQWIAAMIFAAAVLIIAVVKL